MGNAFYVTMERGIRSEANKYGFKIDIQGPQQFDPTLQTPIVNAVVATKPVGLLIAPTDSKAMFVPISQAVTAGIKVALVDTTLDDTSQVITAIATDNTAGGAAAADALAKLIGEKGEVMVIAFQAGASTSDQRQRGFETELKKYPGIKYVGFQISNNDPSKAAAEVGSVLAAHPDLAGIFATNDRSAEGAATGLRVAGRVGAVKVVGFDAGPTPSPAAPQPASAPKLNWGSCSQVVKSTKGVPAAQCGIVTVPVDYANPAGAQVQLAVIKIPATGPRIARPR